MARRRHGSGSIVHRVDGRWEGRLRLADGKRRFIYARDRRRLVAKLQEERWRLATGIPVLSRGLVLSDYLKQWLEVMRCRLRPRTFDSYRLCCQRIERTLGRAPVKRVTPQLVQHRYAQLLERGLSPRTVFQTHAVLHRALKQARHWGLIQSNPTELVAVPRAPYREMPALNSAQLERLFESSRASRWYPLWVVLGTAGLRIGEALGLKWEDVDLVAGRLQTRRALQRRQNTSSELVFPNGLDEPQESSSVTSALEVALERAGLPQIRVHDLRHSCATSWSRPACIPSLSRTRSATARWR